MARSLFHSLKQALRFSFTLPLLTWSNPLQGDFDDGKTLDELEIEKMEEELNRIAENHEADDIIELIDELDLAEEEDELSQELIDRAKSCLVNDLPERKELSRDHALALRKKLRSFIPPDELTLLDNPESQDGLDGPGTFAE